MEKSGVFDKKDKPFRSRQATSLSDPANLFQMKMMQSE